MSSSGIKALAKDTVIYGATNIISKFLNWLLAPFYIRILANSAEYGIVTNLYAWVSVVLVVLTLGLETGLFRFINGNNSTAKGNQGEATGESQRVYATCFKLLLFVVTCFLFLTLPNSVGIATLIGYPSQPEFISIFLLIVAMDALLSIPFAYLRYQRRPWRFACYKFLFILLNIGLNIFFLLLCPYLESRGIALPRWLYRPDYGVGYIFISNLIATSVELICMLPIMQPAFRGFERSLVQPLLRYCLPLVLLGLAGILNKMAGQILLPMLYSDRIEGMTALGIYGGNLKIAVVMVMFIQAFRFAYDPFVFSKMKAMDSGEAYRVAMNYFVLFGTLIFLGVLYFIDLFKHIVAPDYYSGLVVVPIVMASEILFGIYYNLSVWYKVSDHTSYGALFSIIGLVVTLAVIFLGVPKYGFVACAWSAFACNGVMLLLSYFIGQRIHPIRYDVGRILGMLALMLLFYLIGMQVSPASIPLRLTLRSLLLLGYIGLLIAFFAPELRTLLRARLQRHHHEG